MPSISLDKVRCSLEATGKCLIKCSTVEISPMPPFATPTLDTRCMKPCVKSEFEKCLDKLAAAISD